MKRAFVVVSVLLCGCVAQPVTVAPVVTPGLVGWQATAEAGRVTAEAVGVHVAQATEDARGTAGAATVEAGAYALDVTATEQAWRRAVTESVATVTRQAVEFQQTSAAGIARRSETETAGRIALRATQQAGDVARTELAKTASLWGLVISLLAVLLAGVVSLSSWAQMRIQTERDRRDAEIELVRARADRERIMQTAMGVAICRAGDWQVLPGEERRGGELAVVRSVPYTVIGERRDLVLDDPVRGRVVRLLQACPAESVTIPSARSLGWSAGEWVAAVAWLREKGYAMPRRGNGGGTFLRGEHRNVAAVLAEVLHPSPTDADGED